MLTLRTIQMQFRRFIADSESRALLGALDGDVATMAERLSIYRNNSLVTHTTVLSAVFPVVSRLVDTRFFAFLVHEFLRENPPKHPCLSEYGEEFADFVARFPPAREIPYLRDIARLEWAISRVPAAPPARPIPLTQLATRSGDPASARLTFDAPVHFIESEYPIDLIWELNQSTDVAEDTVLNPGTARLQVRGGRSPPWNHLNRADWTFRSSLAGGATLGAGAEKALQVDPGFNLAGALTALFLEDLIVDCT